ncbi:PTS lactose/cellobiose transporter subunit IIA [Streptomyces sp. NPDC002795]|uniref:PTS lactose/cellobiose transporter subunit IIA n=1 Tax=Streptomyces sp. NPDC002795 TaxID=3364665 RepID=UPI0036A3E912
MNDDVARSSMQIILHAGDARNLIRRSLTAVESDSYEEAERFLVEAKEEIAKAHKAQTEFVQAEASGEQQQYSVLFTHAQDTLMTVMSEHGTAQHLLRLFRKVGERISGIENNTTEAGEV